MDPNIAVVIVHRKGSKLAEKAKKIHEIRAGMDCKVYAIEDTNQEGWVQVMNKAFRELDFTHFVYSCDDYFPGRDYLKIAWNHMEKTGKRLVAFNDGKWHGHLATAGLVERRFVESIYKDGLFYTEYKMSYGDTELTDWAIHLDQYTYCPDAVLMEVDYEKETKPHTNIEDKRTYNSRNLDFKRFS